jgi:hypothetical protein
MSYVNKNIQRLINHADACGAGGMKKTGLVYGSDWARLNGNTLRTRTPGNITFTVHGGMNGLNCCGQIATTNTSPSQRAYRSTRGAFN